MLFVIFGKGGRLPPLLISWNKPNKKAPLATRDAKGFELFFFFLFFPGQNVLSGRGEEFQSAGIPVDPAKGVGYIAGHLHNVTGVHTAHFVTHLHINFALQ